MHGVVRHGCNMVYLVLLDAHAARIRLRNQTLSLFWSLSWGPNDEGLGWSHIHTVVFCHHVYAMFHGLARGIYTRGGPPEFHLYVIRWRIACT